MTEEALPDLNRKVTSMHRVEHALLKVSIGFARMLGTRRAARFGEAVGALGYFPFGIRKKLVHENLRAAFPDKDAKWLKRMARETYAHLGREALMTLQLTQMSADEIRERTTIHGDMDSFLADIAKGKGVVMVSGHLGNHEIAAAALAVRGVPMDVVVQRQGNALFDKTLNDSRRAHGMGIIDRFQAHREAIRALRKGRVVAFAADQNAKKGGVFVPFFGRLAATHRGPALFALKTGAPFYVGVAIRHGDTYEVFGHRLDVDRTGNTDEVVERMTAAFTAYLEEVVRTAPDQYLWLHRRWKTRPAEGEGEREDEGEIQGKG